MPRDEAVFSFDFLKRDEFIGHRVVNGYLELCGITMSYEQVGYVD